MKVRCVHIARPDHSVLRIGNEYVVLAISASPGRDIRLQVLSEPEANREPPRFPVLARTDYFETISRKIPSNWCVRVGVPTSPGYLEVAPESWLRDGFWEEFWEGGRNRANNDFDKELAIILREEEVEPDD